LRRRIEALMVPDEPIVQLVMRSVFGKLR